jgi:hypothetical protein
MKEGNGNYTSLGHAESSGSNKYSGERKLFDLDLFKTDAAGDYAVFSCVG